MSDHLAVQAHDGLYHHDLLPHPFTKNYAQKTVERINSVQEFFKEPILVENLSYYVLFKNSDISEIDFIKKVLEQAGCGLLLDLNNVWVNHENFGLDCRGFLDQVPWKKVKEIHLAGPEKFDDLWVDTHGTPLNNELLELLQEYQAGINDKCIVYEQDQNAKNLSTYTTEISKVRDCLYGSV